MRAQLSEQTSLLEEHKGTVTRLDETIKDKDNECSKMREEVIRAEIRAKSENEGMKKELARKTEELAIVKAKMYLDQLQIEFRLVPEYPDMVEENQELNRGLEEQEKTIELQNQVKVSLENQLKLLNTTIAERDKYIESLLVDNEDLNKSLNEALKNLNQCHDILSDRDKMIARLET